MKVWLFVLTFAGFSLVSVKCASIPEQMMSNSKDSGLNPGGMGLPDEHEESELGHAQLRKQGELKQELGGKMKKLNELIEGKDEGFVPWVMGWIHSATNFITADEN